MIDLTNRPRASRPTSPAVEAAVDLLLAEVDLARATARVKLARRELRRAA